MPALVSRAETANVKKLLDTPVQHDRPFRCCQRAIFRRIGRKLMERQTQHAAPTCRQAHGVAVETIFSDRRPRCGARITSAICRGSGALPSFSKTRLSAFDRA